MEVGVGSLEKGKMKRCGIGDRGSWIGDGREDEEIGDGRLGIFSFYLPSTIHYPLLQGVG
jgi:hypothetical protein